MVDGRDHASGIGPPGGGGHLGDAVVDLVLGDVHADDRAAMAAHVLRCATCRREYDELAATVQGLLPAVPGAQPAIGFDERVLVRLTPAGSPARRPAARRRWLAAAAAAAAVAAVAVPAGVWLAARDDPAPASAGELATLRLTRDGASVGTVSVTDVDGDAVMVVALVRAPDDVAYRCRVRFADGTTVDSPTWAAGNGAWLVPLPDGADVTAVEVLPAGTEHVWSTAAFG